MAHASPTLDRARVQVRAGTGGEEAALWAADLIRMYQKYADSQVRGRPRRLASLAAGAAAAPAGLA